MSRAFVESFFPSTTALLVEHVPDTVNYFFPTDLDERCPEVLWRVGGTPDNVVMMIRNPMLALACVTGAMVGARGFMAFYEPRHQSPGFAFAFGSFGAMNAVALPLHCLVPFASSSPAAYPVLWMLDCVFTGVSCLFLMEGCSWVHDQCTTTLPPLSIKRRIAITMVRLPIRNFGLAVMVIFLLNAMIGWGAVGQDTVELPVSSAMIRWKEPFWVEWIYLGPLVAAASLCPLGVLASVRHAYINLRNEQVSSMSRLLMAVVIMGTGLGMGLLGVVLVDWSCRNVPPSIVRDAVSAPTMVFTGCNVCFIGLHAWLRGLEDQEKQQQALERRKR